VAQRTETIGLVGGIVRFSTLHNLAGTDSASATSNAVTLEHVERSPFP
jgi:hypothetical protein